MKKLVDGDRWNDRWFRRQDRVDKVLMCWLWDKADCGGFVELDFEDVLDDIGLSAAKSYEGLGRLSKSYEELARVRKSSEELRTVTKSYEGLRRLYIAECEDRPDKVWVWIANYVKVQVGLTDLRKKGGGPVIGMLRRMKEMEDLFPAVRKTYKGFGRVTKSSEELRRVTKSYEPSIQYNTISGISKRGESEGSSPRTTPIEATGEYKLTHEDELYEKIIGAGLDVKWIPWQNLQKSYPPKDIKWPELVAWVIEAHVNSSEGVDDPWKYMRNLCQKPSYMKGVMKTDVDQDKEAHAKRRGVINDMWASGKIVDKEGKADPDECTRLHEVNNLKYGVKK